MKHLECLIIGGGPAGLTAALYLGRFNRSTLLVDAGASRTSWIPKSRSRKNGFRIWGLAWLGA
jgi:thioredoxin reductase (NADPH)